MEIPEGLRRFKYNLIPYDLRIQDQYKIVQLIEEMAEELQDIQDAKLPELREEFVSLKKFKEWK